MSKILTRYLPFTVLAISLGLAGCHKNTDQSTDSSDPAAANEASDTGQTADQSTAAQQPQQSYAPAPAPAPARHRRVSSAADDASNPPEPPADNSGSYANTQYDNGGSYDNGSSYNDETQYAPEYQPVYAPAPPPPIPVYEQPPCPGVNYQWTPGYWNYSSNGGYYWVPGVWIAPPYYGALWTPGYWAFGGGHYGFHHGYWGIHIGFYGGVSYGFGYYGHGYEGGYWHDHDFFYNRAVVHVNDNVVRNVYVHPVTVNNITINNVTTNNYVINNNINRISYNGGNGGVRAQALPYEVAAAREQHIAALPQQVAHIQQASMNHAQFASVNNGRPQILGPRSPSGSPPSPARPVCALSQAARRSLLLNSTPRRRSRRIARASRRLLLTALSSSRVPPSTWNRPAPRLRQSGLR
jgi:hypothetical protein